MRLDPHLSLPVLGTRGSIPVVRSIGRLELVLPRRTAADPPSAGSRRVTRDARLRGPDPPPNPVLRDQKRRAVGVLHCPKQAYAGISEPVQDGLGKGFPGSDRGGPGLGRPRAQV